MAYDSTAFAHREWIGYVQPVGVVVSTPALLEAGAAINRNFVPLHRAFLSVLPQDRDGNPIPELTSFSAFAKDVRDGSRKTWSHRLIASSSRCPVMTIT